ncbi:hypothetical protein BC629DRAFT_1295105 [Irpex lacteus]|nr:hypothetical protein BC629DRAFT_1295105 [Irpex lacteus]
MKQLPLPEPIHGFKDDIQPRSVHFTPDGKAAIVSYLSHGIWCWNVETGENLWKIMPRTPLGRTAASADRNVIVASNLYNGFDCYSTITRSLVHTFRTRITHNVPLPIEFIHDSAALLFGSSCGDVTLWELESHNWVDSLRHAGQSLVGRAYTEVGDRRYIATGVSEPIEQARVCIWSSARPKSMTVAIPTVTASRRKVRYSPRTLSNAVPY